MRGPSHDLWGGAGSKPPFRARRRDTSVTWNEAGDAYCGIGVLKVVAVGPWRGQEFVGLPRRLPYARPTSSAPVLHAAVSIEPVPVGGAGQEGYRRSTFDRWRAAVRPSCGCFDRTGLIIAPGICAFRGTPAAGNARPTVLAGVRSHSGARLPWASEGRRFQIVRPPRPRQVEYWSS